MGFKPLYGRRLQDIKISKHSTINARTIVAPIVALTMASIVFVYARSSIYAAKRNAKMHREADGGQISWRNESQRRHGVLNKPPETLSLKGLLNEDGDENQKSGLKDRVPQISKEEEVVRARRVIRGKAQR